MQPLTHTSPMPWGKKHKGTAMQDVPADYLMWIYENSDGILASNSPVAAYIKQNLEAIKAKSPNHRKGIPMKNY